MNQCVKKLIASILFVFPLLMVTSVFADVEKTNESTQSENQSFDKTTFSEESITSETTESQSEASTNKRQEENKTSETSEVLIAVKRHWQELFQRMGTAKLPQQKNWRSFSQTNQ
ncbi:TPA: hypothetical protein RW185_001403 [Enterococcus faecium]|nr:hypothetical protein [Enterococcus faecium]EHM3038155.1 hypothetical protein [Enterococcus faecium]EME8149129.1 hypothetical protein [Enterococcus faecium]HEA4500509.1 hypothetical protein [Enterococcus faecium]